MRPSRPPPVRSILVDDQPLEIDLATTLLYGASHYSYRQIARQVASLNEARRNEIIALGARHRGRHDELLREFSAGQGLRFDILMDIGGFRDMHRHRRCVQILQPFTNAHGYEVPEGLADAGLLPQYDSAMTQAHEAFVQVSSGRPDGECALRFASGHAHPRSLQDGLRRSAVHRGTALYACRTFLLPPRRLGDVPGSRPQAPGARPVLSRC